MVSLNLQVPIVMKTTRLLNLEVSDVVVITGLLNRGVPAVMGIISSRSL
jgi:riboflavin transporter FmnP